MKMFNAVIALPEPIVAVQVNPELLANADGTKLLARLENYFMKPVALVAWDRDARFVSQGFEVPEKILTDDNVHWREFELPPLPEIPF